MTAAEDLVLGAAAMLAMTAAVERRHGGLAPRMGSVLWALALLAAALALLHAEARVMAAW